MGSCVLTFNQTPHTLHIALKKISSDQINSSKHVGIYRDVAVRVAKILLFRCPKDGNNQDQQTLCPIRGQEKEGPTATLFCQAEAAACSCCISCCNFPENGRATENP